MADDPLALLRSGIREAIARGCPVAACRDAVFERLERPGLALHAQGPCRAGSFALETHRAVAGHLSRASLQAACAVELCMESAYLFDAVADRPSADPTITAEELAMALVLLSCASAALQAVYDVELAGLPPVHAAMHFHRQCARAATGQFLDARFERRKNVSVREALLMTALKAGSFGRMAAGAGAALATRDAATIRMLERLGFHLFTYAQLVDDLRDACRGAAGHDDLSAPGPDDLACGKKTVPLAFFHRHVRSACGSEDHARMEPSRHEAFEGCGAAVFGRVVAETFLNRARRCVADLEGRGLAVANLAFCVEQLRPAA